MRYLERLGLAQRIVLVVGLGLGLLILGFYFMFLGSPAAQFGWFGYAPLTDNVLVRAEDNLSAWQQMLIWIGLIVTWTIAGIVILSRPKGQ